MNFLLCRAALPSSALGLPTSPASSSSWTSSPRINTCFLLFMKTCDWHHPYQGCLVELGLGVHDTVCPGHFNPHCFIDLPDHTAAENTSLFHREFCFLSFMLNQAVFPQGISFFLQSEATEVLLSPGEAVAACLPIICAAPASPQAGLTLDLISTTILLTIS